MATKDKLDTEQVARAYFAAIGKRDLDGMAAVWKPGSTDHMVGMQERAMLGAVNLRTKAAARLRRA
jgi:hypothetical protein